MRRITCILGSAVLLLSIQAYNQPCWAQTVYLTLTVGGVELEGSSIATTLDREGTIPCLSYYDGLKLADGLERTTTRHAFEPIVCTKVLDQTSPRLWQALQSGERVTGEFRFFQNDGRGVERHFYTVSIEDAAVASINTISTNGPDPFAPAARIFEEVTFIYRSIVRTFEATGAEYSSGGG